MQSQPNFYRLDWFS